MIPAIPPFEEEQPPPPPKRWFLFLSDSENPSYGYAGIQAWAGIQPGSIPSAPTLRRATPDDLEKLGYLPAASDIAGEPEGAMLTAVLAVLDSLPRRRRVTMLSLLHERYAANGELR
jgi:hypothetical protein